jgi:hypothetical protein
MHSCAGQERMKEIWDNMKEEVEKNIQSRIRIKGGED